jgi:2OG-Fe(II) oxygenase superfamily
MTPILPLQLDAGLFLDHAEARRIGESLADSYCFADPFPHIVLDNFFPADVVQMALDNFPAQALQSDRVFEMGYAGLHKRQVLPAECNESARALFHFFNSQPMLQFLEGLSAIPGLLPDPYFVGGGFHETTRGGKLGVHADFRVNEQLSLQRRMNVIVYLNPEWDDAYGGHLELWDRQMTKRAKSVAPVLNRCVIFNTDADSFHGHPDPLTTPEGVARRSMALYYYTASKSIINEIPTLDTIYHARPTDGDAIQREARALRKEQWMRQWIPPAMLRYVYAVRRRLGS